MPEIDAELIDRLIAAFDPGSGRSIVVPTHNGKRGNPVLWASSFFPAMAALEGDVGARQCRDGMQRLLDLIDALARRLSHYANAGELNVETDRNAAVTFLNLLRGEFHMRRLMNLCPRVSARQRRTVRRYGLDGSLHGR